jgi:hypothetical protein
MAMSALPPTPIAAAGAGASTASKDLVAGAALAAVQVIYDAAKHSLRQSLDFIPRDVKALKKTHRALKAAVITEGEAKASSVLALVKSIDDPSAEESESSQSPTMPVQTYLRVLRVYGIRRITADDLRDRGDRGYAVNGFNEE